jgi:hypothetical protein
VTYAAMTLNKVTRMVLVISILTIPHYGIDEAQGNLCDKFLRSRIKKLLANFSQVLVKDAAIQVLLLIQLGYVVVKRIFIKQVI